MIGKRINVVGCSGSGKSTLSKALSEMFAYKHIELDAFQHRENWRQSSDEEFLGYVAEAIKADTWVIDGNYRKMRPLSWPHVDTIIILDYGFWTCLSRVWRRTFRRWRRREVLWNGNQEHLWWHFFTKDSLLLWVITTHAKKRVQFAEILNSTELRDKTILHFTSPKQTQTWLESLQHLSRNEDRVVVDESISV